MRWKHTHLTIVGVSTSSFNVPSSQTGAPTITIATKAWNTNKLPIQVHKSARYIKNSSRYTET